MNTIRRVMLAAVIIGFAASSGHSQDPSVHTQSVPFENPGRPGIVRVISGEGDISITGYAGRDVRIKATGTHKKPRSLDDDPKAKGLKRIAGSGFSVATDREENAVVITRPMDDSTDLELQVPFNTSVKIGGAPSKEAAGDVIDIPNIVVNSVIAAVGSGARVLEGDITVENITGEVEISSLDGDINLKNISGAAVVNCIDGDITAVFRTVPESRPMAFSTIDGDIDITLPERIKATITTSNIEGGVYTDFEMATVPGAVKKSEKGTSGIIAGLTGLRGNAITGKINGGGIEIQIKTIDGGIYIRKGK